MDRSAFHKLLAFGLERGASDIHFEAGYAPHYRVHGELLGALKVPLLTAEDTEAIARMVLDERSVAVDLTRRFREIGVSYSLAQRGRFRATIFRQRDTVAIAMRLVPIQVRSLEELHLPAAVGESLGARSGLVLVAGVSGGGKTTAMAAMLRHLNETRHAHVVSIEDPIEFLHEPQRCLIVQREIGADTEGYADALRAALRQDADVIVLGELADREAASLALRAAEAGPLVIAGLHAPDAASAIRRLLGLLELPGAAPEPELRGRLADALQAVVALRLLAGREGGRIPAVEVLRRTREVRELLWGGALGELPALMRKSREAPAMQVFDQHLQELVASGAISREVALASSTSPDELEQALRAS